MVKMISSHRYLTIFTILLVICFFLIYHFERFNLHYSKPKIHENFTIRGCTNRTFLYNILLQVNDLQTILNQHIQDEVKVIIVIQVHNRLEYLQNFIKSLQSVRHIENALLVFSHDVYDATINHLVRSIDFARVLQIFFPYSQQLFNRHFPGRCTCHKYNNNTNDSTTLCLSPSLNCSCPRRQQMKHHWFWKMNFVFLNLKGYETFEDLFLFFEEDDYVLEDALHVLFLMRKMQKEMTKKIDVLCLSRRDMDMPDLDGLTNEVIYESAIRNSGIAFERNVWNKFVAFNETFCTYNHYGWDHTLAYINELCFPTPITQLVLKKSPRALHFGLCGIHAKSTICSSQSKVDQINKILIKNGTRKHLFPSNLTLVGESYHNESNKIGYGFWNDSRDHELCRSYTKLSDSTKRNSNLLLEKNLMKDSSQILLP